MLRRHLACTAYLHHHTLLVLVVIVVLVIAVILTGAQSGSSLELSPFLALEAVSSLLCSIGAVEADANAKAIVARGPCPRQGQQQSEGGDEGGEKEVEVEDPAAAAATTGKHRPEALGPSLRRQALKLTGKLLERLTYYADRLDFTSSATTAMPSSTSSRKRTKNVRGGNQGSSIRGFGTESSFSEARYTQNARAASFPERDDLMDSDSNSEDRGGGAGRGGGRDGFFSDEDEEEENHSGFGSSRAPASKKRRGKGNGGGDGGAGSSGWTDTSSLGGKLEARTMSEQVSLWLAVPAVRATHECACVLLQGVVGACFPERLAATSLLADRIAGSIAPPPHQPPTAQQQHNKKRQHQSISSRSAPQIASRIHGGGDFLMAR